MVRSRLHSVNTDNYDLQLANAKKQIKRTARFGGMFMLLVITISGISSCALIYLMYAAAQWLMANQ